MSMISDYHCPVCQGPADLLSVTDGGPCMNCVKARHRTAVNHNRCMCGRKAIPNPEIHKIGSRTWQSCDRCLGTIKQLS